MSDVSHPAELRVSDFLSTKSWAFFFLLAR